MASYASRYRAMNLPNQTPVDVEDLMLRIRREVDRRQAALPQLAGSNGHSLLPPLQAPALPPPPTLYVSDGAAPVERFQKLAAAALQKTEVDRRIPKLLRRLFRKQGGFNKLLLDIGSLLFKSNAKLHQKNSEVVAYLTAQNHWFQDWVEDRKREKEWLGTICPLINQFNAKIARVEGLLTDLQQTVNDVENDVRSTEDETLRMADQLNTVKAQAINLSEQFNDSQSGIDQLTVRLRNFEEQRVSDVELLQRLEISYAAIDEYTSALHGQLDEMRTSHNMAREEVSEIQTVQDKLGQGLRALGDGMAETAGKILNLDRDLTAVREQAVERQVQAAVTDRELTSLREKIGGLQDWLSVHETKANTAAQELVAVKERLVTRETEAAATLQDLTALRENIGGLQGWLSDRESLVYTISQSVASLEERMLGYDTTAAGAAGEVTELRENIGGLKEWLGRVANNASQLAGLVEGIRAQADQIEQRQTTDAAFLKAQISFQNGVLQTFSARSRGLRDKGKKANFTLDIDQHANDAFYLAFENKFRGTRADIQQRVRVYLPSIRASGAGSVDRPILDLGCGRGEWLELLRAENRNARGVDLNQFMVAECIERGLPVEQVDAVQYLSSLPADSYGAVTAFHLIEHLPFAALLRLFAESLRVLRTGGICIFETPNPDNIQVGSNRFYMDPTHIRPLPKDYTKFVMSNAGFSRVAALPLHPVESPPQLDANALPLEQFVNQIFFGEQDYAVIGYK